MASDDFTPIKYIQKFVIGPSYIMMFPFLFCVNKTNKKNYSFTNYAMIAPIWFGLWNVVSLLLAEELGLSNRMRFVFVSIFSYIFIAKFVSSNKSYNFTKIQWIQYYIFLFCLYFFQWNVVIYYLEKIFSSP